MDRHLAGALHCADQHPDFEGLIQVHQHQAVQFAAFLHRNLDDFGAALGKGIPFQKGGVLHQPEDLLGGGALGVHHHVQPHALLEQIDVLGVFGAPHAGDGVGAAQLPGDHAAEDIGLIGVGDRDQKIGVRYACGLLDLHGSPVPFQNLDVQGGLRPVERFLLAVDDHQIMSFGHQGLGQRKTDFSVADDNDFHEASPFSDQTVDKHPS